ncbi:hypothetical protein BJP36_39070 [Moorena producens JHB]|uniref:Uncharacterized protein n=1 Tax=Moorena producens (strain JHB) TaxID=1454205 RepID=A0A9Q9UWP5_MOOP1|nr:hypothetical protein [Moorena producens]WAN70068.1 hypothetical protein BJP36_39070 [Moorena producens JHB]
MSIRYLIPDSLGALSVGELNSPRVAPLPTPDSLGALSVGELNSPRVAPLPTPDSRFPIPHT